MFGVDMRSLGELTNTVNCTSKAWTPFGTSTWNAYMSTRSRCHSSARPPADTLISEMSPTGPDGPCSPGVHFGYTKVNGPGCDGIRIVEVINPRPTSRASNTSVSGFDWVA